MAEPTPYNVSDAITPSGFIDFYQMLGIDSSASIEEIRARINSLYSEAQANRDHRNLNKRREYQTLLEYLPQARTALLEADKRARYDSYAATAVSGTPEVDFPTFMGQLSGATAQDDRTDVLGVQDGAKAAPRTTTTATTTATARRSKGANASRTKQGLMGSAMSVIVFTILLALVYVITRDLGLGLLVGAIAGAVTWIVTHRGGGGVSV
jgi:hypothetical protein